MLAVDINTFDRPDKVFTTRRFCKSCEVETQHEIHSVHGIVSRVCMPCSERDRYYELDRD